MRVVIIALLLAGCGPKPGTPVKINAPQAAEQCEAQPQLAWCKPHE